MYLLNMKVPIPVIAHGALTCPLDDLVTKARTEEQGACWS